MEKQKPTIESALKSMLRDKEEIRKTLGLSSTLLTTENLPLIEKLIKEYRLKKRRQYSRYDLAHHFIVDHTITLLKSTLHLTDEEKSSIRAVMGRVYYNPPAREDLEIAQAAEALHSKGQRGIEIFKALTEETEKFWRMLNSANMDIDTFHNPDWRPQGIRLNNFDELAKAKRTSYTEYTKDKGSKKFDEEHSFYK